MGILFKVCLFPYHNASMKKIIFKIFAYIFIRYIFSWVGMYFIGNENAKLLRPSDIRTGDDSFFAMFIFGLPLILDLLILGLPLFYIMKKFSIKKKIDFYFFILILLILDFILSYNFYGGEYAAFKLLLNILLFPLFFMISFKKSTV